MREIEGEEGRERGQSFFWGCERDFMILIRRDSQRVFLGFPRRGSIVFPFFPSVLLFMLSLRKWRRNHIRFRLLEPMSCLKHKKTQ